MAQDDPHLVFGEGGASNAASHLPPKGIQA
jgi:hypothetical protein